MVSTALVRRAGLAGGLAALCLVVPAGLSLVAPEPEPLPATQQAFLAAVAQGRASLDEDPNELKRRQIHRLRDQAVCAAVPGRVVSDWTGRVDELFLDQDAQDAQAALTISLDHDVRFATHDDADDDAQAQTLLPEGSPVYQALLDLHEGDRVRFSGLLLPGDDGCLDETSATSSGAMSSPTFRFRFTAVVPAPSGPGD